MYTGVVMFDRPLDNSRENTSRNNAQTTYARVNRNMIVNPLYSENILVKPPIII